MSESIDLASERLGGTVLAASDEFFAPKENLIKSADPVYREGEYTGRGKLMDGWETRRRRGPGHDWCIVRLGAPGIVLEVVVDTAHFKGNYPESCSLEGCSVDGDPDLEELSGAAWVELFPVTPLEGDATKAVDIEAPCRLTHVRFNIFPDGGVARLRIHGEVLPDPARLRAEGEVDLAALQNGGEVVECSDRFFGSPGNLLLPGVAAHMGEGWETRRRRGSGHDWVVVKLGLAGSLREVEVDTTHFKGNYPESCSIESCFASGDDLDDALWQEVLSRTSLQANLPHRFREELTAAEQATHVRFNIFPDGGVARLRLLGRPTAEAWRELGLRWLNALPSPAAERELLACCGSNRWAQHMAARRPFSDLGDLLAASDLIWGDLDRSDVLQAFAAHPRIGESAVPGAGAGRGWSVEEQAATVGAGREVLQGLVAANRAYEAKFGYIFIVSATGKSADEMLTLLRKRLDNSPEEEVQVAAEEQRSIASLRLEKLIGRAQKGA